jgi:hypothetical protein
MDYKKIFVIVDLETKKYVCIHRVDNFLSANIEDALEFDSEEEAIKRFKEEQDNDYFCEIKTFKIRSYYKIK